MNIYGTYSFMDVQANFVGPGALINLGNGAGVAKEGITITPREDKTSQIVGADGNWMTSLHAGTPGNISVRLLKTSPVNALLSAAYNFQSTSSANWGQNVISIRLPNWLDTITCIGVAFTRLPEVLYAEDGNTNEWQFMAGQIVEILGSGSTITSQAFVG